MANTLEPSWNGNDYQARFFWYHAAALRDDQQQHVVEVTFEADGPKGFDDVVVRYRPPGRPSSSPPGRIAVDFHQVKFHAVQGGRFGYTDLIRPEFINATANSLLQGLRNAKKTTSSDAAFHLVTTDRIADDDPLADIISGKDHSFRFDKLFAAGGDRSKFGKVRKLWREHLQLATDDELKQVLQGLHINQIARSLEDSVRADGYPLRRAVSPEVGVRVPACRDRGTGGHRHRGQAPDRTSSNPVPSPPGPASSPVWPVPQPGGGPAGKRPRSAESEAPSLAHRRWPASIRSLCRPGDRASGV